MPHVKKRLPYLIIFLLVGVAYALGGLARFDNFLTDLRFGLTKRPATGDLVVVEIDSRSLNDLNVWPWPRTIHAALVDALVEAGVEQIAFDVDFSAWSSEEADRALQGAFERAEGRTILAVFRQSVERVDGTVELVHNVPIPLFRQHTRPGTANIHPESDGLVRQYSRHEDWGGSQLGSIGALLAGDAESGSGSFLIDFGIKAGSVPRLSYVDVLQGNFDPAALAGKSVIIGGTAIELGDQIATPIYRALPGVYLHALAYESLTQNRTLTRLGIVPILAVGLFLALLLGPLLAEWSWRRSLIAIGVGAALLFLISLGVHAVFPVILDIAPWLLTLVGVFATGLLLNMDQLAMRIFIQRMAVLHRREMMKSVVEDSFHGILIVNYEGRIEMFNSAASALLGYDQEEVLRQPVEHVMPEVASRVQTSSAVHDAASQVGAVAIFGPAEINVKRKGGSEVPLELVVSESYLRVSKNPMERRKEPRRVHIYTFRDVTERKRLEAAQKQAMDEAIAANRSKSEFLAMMSHELRTPLNAIIGFSEIIKEQMFGPVGSEQYTNYADDIHQSGSHLLSLVNDILSVSKVEAGEFTLGDDHIVLGPLVERCVKMVEPHAAETKVSIQVEMPEEFPALRADERLVKQILVNLMSNAVKFNKEGGTVTVRAGATDSEGITIEVSDTGIGIDLEHLAKVTEPFNQVDSALSRKFEGTGLGLYLVAKFMELHGGEFEIDSELDVGTQVTVRFPAERIARAEDVAEQPEVDALPAA